MLPSCDEPLATLTLSAATLCFAGEANIEYLKPDGLLNVPSFSQVTTASEGTMVFVSGQVSWDEKGNVLHAGDLKAQTRKTYENVKLALVAAGATFDDVVKFTVRHRRRTIRGQDRCSAASASSRASRMVCHAHGCSVALFSHWTYNGIRQLCLNGADMRRTQPTANPEQRRSRGARLGFRVDDQTKALVERAAELERRKLTEYCLTALTEAARRTIARHEMLVLSDRERHAFFDALINPPKPHARLRRAARTERKQIAP